MYPHIINCPSTMFSHEKLCRMEVVCLFMTLVTKGVHYIRVVDTTQQGKGACRRLRCSGNFAGGRRLEALGQEGTMDRHIHTRAVESRRGSAAAAAHTTHACMRPPACVPLTSDGLGPTRTRLPRTYGTVAHHPLSRSACSRHRHGTQMLFFFQCFTSPFPGCIISLRTVLVLASRNYHVTCGTRRERTSN